MNCKRLTVYATGIDRHGNTHTARNYNKSMCNGITGKCGCVHAEQALLDAMPRPVFVMVSHSPCRHCAIALHTSGVREVKYVREYRKRDGIEYLRSVGIVCERITGIERKPF